MREFRSELGANVEADLLCDGDDNTSGSVGCNGPIDRPEGGSDPSAVSGIGLEIGTVCR